MTAIRWGPTGNRARFVLPRLPRSWPRAAGEHDHRACLRLAAFPRPAKVGAAGKRGVFRMCRSVARRHFQAALCVGLIAAVGCGGGPKIVPVSGKATVDGNPLAGFVVAFNADPDKGHDFSRVSCKGRIQKDGQYSLTTDDGFKQTKGAPVGWYKVTIFSPEDKPIPVHKKYTEFKTTALTIEVVADAEPGAYDLKFTR